jgi:hypothetical protein
MKLVHTRPVFLSLLVSSTLVTAYFLVDGCFFSVSTTLARFNWI